MRVTLRLTLFVLAAAAALTGARSPAPPDGTKMAGSLDELARESLAKIDDELQVAGLKQPVDIIRDQQGIPHIYAKSDDDLFFAANLIGGGEPPFVGVDAGSNEHMAWGFTFAGTDMVDLVVEQTNPADPNQTKFRGAWATSASTSPTASIFRCR